MPNPLDPVLDREVISDFNLPSKTPVPPGLQPFVLAFEKNPSQTLSSKEYADVVNNIQQSDPMKPSLSDLGNNIDIKPMGSSLSFRLSDPKATSRYERDPKLWEKVGFNPEIPSNVMDAMYDFRETTWESLKSWFPKLANTTAFQYKNYFTEYMDAAEALVKTDSSVLFNQERFTDYKKRMDELEDLYPDYKTDKPVKWYDIGRGDWWEESSSSLGFTLGTIGAALTESAVITGVTGGIGAIPTSLNSARKVFKSIADYYSMRRGLALLKTAVKGKDIASFANAVGTIYRTFNGALSEATLEGATAKMDFEEAYKNEFFQKNGRNLTKEELKALKATGDSIAKSVIIFQTPFLMASNAVQFGNIIAPKTFGKLFGKGPKIATEGLESIIEQPAKSSIFSKIGKGFVGSSWEGVEESYQSIVTKSAQDYYQDILDKNDKDLLKSIGTGFDYAGSNEGLKEFMAGVVTGGIFQHVGKPLHYIAKPKEVEKDGEKTFDLKWYNKYLGLGMETVREKENLKKLEKMAEKLNSVALQDVFKEEGILSLLKDKRTSFVLSKFIENGDVFNLKNTQNLILNKFLYAGLIKGKIDLQLEKLKNFADLDFETLKGVLSLDENDFASTEDKENFIKNLKQFSVSVENIAPEFEKIYDQSHRKYNKFLSNATRVEDASRRVYNNILQEMLGKYKKEENSFSIDDVTEERDKELLKQAKINMFHSQAKKIAIEEGIKDVTFAQVGMKNSSKRARSIVNDLNKIIDSSTFSELLLGTSINFNFLNELFHKNTRKEFIKNFKDKEALYVLEENDPRLKNHFKQVDLLQEIDNILEEKYDDKLDTLSDKISDFFSEEVKKENSKIPFSYMFDKSKIIDFLKLQNQYQENLDMLNFLEENNNFIGTINDSSDKITDFFYDIIDKIKNEESVKEKDLSDPIDPENNPPENPPSDPNNPPSNNNPVVTDKEKIEEFINALIKEDIELADSLISEIKDINKDIVISIRNAKKVENTDLQEYIDSVLEDIFGKDIFGNDKKVEIMKTPEGDFQIKYDGIIYFVYKDEPLLFFVEKKDETLEAIELKNVPDIVKSELKKAQEKEEAPKEEAPQEPLPKENEIVKKQQLEEEPVVENEVYSTDGEFRVSEPSEIIPAETSINTNIISVATDNARTLGKYAFVTQNPNEEKERDNENFTATLATLENKDLRRQHYIYENLSKNILKDDFPKLKVKLQKKTEDNKKWYVHNEMNTSLLISVIVDANGKEVLFTEQGEITTDDTKGIPFAVEIETDFYEGQKLKESRNSLSGVTTSITPGYITENPIGILLTALDNNIPIYGNFEILLSGRLASVNYDLNKFSQSKQAVKMRTVQEAIDSKQIEIQDYTVKINGHTVGPVRGVWDYGFESNSSINQRVKIGKPYLYDAKSDLFIPLEGKKLRDVTFNGEKIPEDSVLWFIISTLNDNEEVTKEDLINKYKTAENPVDEETATRALERAYVFLRDMLYSKSMSINFQEQGIIIKRNTLKRSSGKILDIPINYIKSSSDKDLYIIPLSAEKTEDELTISMDKFLYENFTFGATLTKIAPNDERFTKVNKRMIFSLEMDEKSIIERLSGNKQVEKEELSTEVIEEGNLFLKNNDDETQYEVIHVDNLKVTLKTEDNKQVVVDKFTFSKSFRKGAIAKKEKENSYTEKQKAVFEKLKGLSTFFGAKKDTNRENSISATKVAKIYPIESDKKDSTFSNGGNVVDYIVKHILSGNIDKISYQDKIQVKSGNSTKEIAISQFLTNEDYNILLDITTGFYNRLSEEYMILTDIQFSEIISDKKIKSEADLLLIDKNGKVTVGDIKTLSSKLPFSQMLNQSAYDALDTNGEYFSTQLFFYKFLLDSKGIQTNNTVKIFKFLPIYTDEVTEENVSKKFKIESNPQEFNLDITMLPLEYKKATNIKELIDIYLKIKDTKESLGETLSVFSIKKQVQAILNLVKKIDESKPLEMSGDLNAVEISKDLFTSQLQKVIDMFGGDFTYRLAEYINTKKYADWTPLGVTFFKKLVDGLAFHEGWHNFSQLYLTIEEKVKLYDEIKKDAITFTDRNKRTYNTKNLDYRNIEEFLAEEFVKFARNPDSYKYPGKTYKGILGIFQKLWDMIRYFFGKRSNAQRLFQDLYYGNLTRYSKSNNNIMFDSLQDTIYNDKGEQVLLPSRLQLYVSSNDSFINQQLRQSKQSVSFIRIMKKPEVLKNNILLKYKETLNTFLQKFYFGDNDISLEYFLNNRDKVLKDTIKISSLNEAQIVKNEQIVIELHNLIDDENNNANFNVFYEYALKNSAIDYVKQNDNNISTILDDVELQDIVEDFEQEDFEEEEEFSNGGSKRNEYNNKGANDEAPIVKATKDIRSYFLTFPKVLGWNNDEPIFELNELGLPISYEGFELFDQIKHLLANKKTFDEQVDALTGKYIVDRLPGAKLIAQDLMDIRESGKSNHINYSFVFNFINIMSLPYVSNKELTINYDSFTTKMRTISTKGIEKQIRKAQVRYHEITKDKKLGIIDDDMSYKKLTQETDLSNMIYNIDGVIYLNPLYPFEDLKPAKPKEFLEQLGIKFKDQFWDNELARSRASNLAALLIKNFENYRDYFLQNTLISTINKTSLYNKNEDFLNRPNPSEIKNLLTYNLQSKYFKKLSNPISFFKESKMNSELSIISIYPHLEMVAESNSKITLEDTSSQFTNGDSKTKNAFYEKSLMTERVDLLNRIFNVSDFNKFETSFINPNKSPWLKRTVLYKNMFDKDGKRKTIGNEILDRTELVKIELADLSSFKIKEKNLFSTYHPNNLTVSQKFYFDLLTCLEDGYIEIPRAANSSAIFAYKLNGYGIRRKGTKGSIIKHPISLKDITKASFGSKEENFQIESNKFIEIMLDYFLIDIEKLQWYSKNKPKSNVANKLNIFKDILSEELKDKILLESKNNTPGKILDLNKKEIIDDIYNFFKNEAKSILKTNQSAILKMPRKYQEILSAAINVQTGKELFADEVAAEKQFKLTQEYGESDKTEGTNIVNVREVNKESLQKIATFYIMNHFINRVEYYNWFMGDIYQFKNPFKRGKVSTNTGTTIKVDDTIKEILNDLSTESISDLIRRKEGKDPLNKDFEVINTVTVNDVITPSLFLDKMINERIDYEKQFINLKEEDIEKRKSELLDEYSPKNAKGERGGFSAINSADGQAKISLDSYRKFQILHSQWDWVKDEKEYKRQLAITRVRYNLYFDKNGNKIEQIGDLRKNDLDYINKGPYNIGFNPLKMSHSGPIIQNIEGAPMETSFDKMSVKPLIPEKVIGKGDADEELFLQMAFHNIDYAKHQSVEKVTTNESIIQFYDEYGNKTDNNITESDIQKLYSSDFKTQLSTKGFKKINIVGTQARAQLFDVLYLQEVKDNPELKSKLESLQSKYLDDLESLMDIKKKFLYNKFGLEKVNDEIKIVDMKKMISSIKLMIKLSKLPKNINDYIDVSSEEDFVRSISTSLGRRRIMDSIGGIIDESTRRLHLNGTAAIQTTAVGNTSVKFKKASKESVDKYKNEDLQFYTFRRDKNNNIVGINSMGVKITLAGDFKNLLNIVWEGKKISTIENLNNLLQNENFRKKYQRQLSFHGYRIPTNNLNFLVNAEIMEFLPESEGNIIITPREFIVAAGTDFDIDKLNLLFPSINKRGNMTSTTEIIDIKRKTYDKKEGKYITTTEAITLKQKPLNEILNEINKITDDKEEFLNVQSTIKKIVKMDKEEIKYLQRIREFYKSKVEKELFELFQNKYIQLRAESNNLEEIMNELVLEDDENVLSLSDNFIDNFDKYKLLNDKLEGYESPAEKLLNEDFFELIYSLNIYEKEKSNSLLNTILTTLDSPVYYQMLTAPSNTKYLGDIFNEIGNITGKDITDTSSSSRNMTPSVESSIHFDFNEQGGHLGSYAILRKWFSLLQYGNTTINKEWNYKGKKMKIYTPLSKKGDLTSIKIPSYTDDGIFIPNIIDQLMSLTIDLANDPLYTKGGINKVNKHIYGYLTMMGYDQKSILALLNQPILKKLYNNVEELSMEYNGVRVGHGILSTMFNEKISINIYDYRKKETRSFVPSDIYEYKGESIVGVNPFVPQIGTYIKENGFNDDISFSKEDLLKNLTNPNKDFQKNILMYFAMLEMEARQFNNLHFALTEDRVKNTNYFSTMENDKKLDEIESANFFTKESVDKIRGKSIYSLFSSVDFVKSTNGIFNSLYNTITFQTIVDIILKKSNVFKSTEKTALIEKIQNDWIEYIYKNYANLDFVQYDVKNDKLLQVKSNFSLYFIQNIYNDSNKSDYINYSDKFNLFFNKYPELKSIPFVKKLQPIGKEPSFSSLHPIDKKVASNIFFERKNTNINDINLYIEQFKNLIYFEPTEFILERNYSTVDIAKISSFFKELAYLALYQGGGNNTSDNFSDLIPADFLKEFIDESFDQYEDYSNNKKIHEYPEQYKKRVIKAFMIMFIENNHNEKWKSSKEIYNLDNFENQEEIIKIREEKRWDEYEPINFFNNFATGKLYYYPYHDNKFTVNSLKECK